MNKNAKINFNKLSLLAIPALFIAYLPVAHAQQQPLQEPCSTVEKVYLINDAPHEETVEAVTPVQGGGTLSGIAAGDTIAGNGGVIVGTATLGTLQSTQFQQMFEGTIELQADSGNTWGTVKYGGGLNSDGSCTPTANGIVQEFNRKLGYDLIMPDNDADNAFTTVYIRPGNGELHHENI